MAAARQIRNEQNWKNLLTFVVTDAYCDVHDPATIQREKNQGDQNIAVVVNSSSTAHLAHVFDEIYRPIKRKWEWCW